MAPKRARAPPAGLAWGAGPFSAGDSVRYWDASAGEVRDATVQRVDASVQPPSYAVLLRGGQTRDTEASRLARVGGEAEVRSAVEAGGAAKQRSPRRSAAAAGGAGGATTPRRTPRRGAGAAAAEGPSPAKRARSSQAADAASPRARRGGAARGKVGSGGIAQEQEQSDDDEAGRPGPGAMGLVHIVVTAMAVTTAALAALRRL